jgi:hypothetical protein
MATPTVMPALMVGIMMAATTVIAMMGTKGMSVLL